MTEERDRTRLKSWQILKQLWPAVRPFRIRFGFSIFFLLIATALEVVSPLVIGESVDVAVAGKNTKLLGQFCLAYLALIVMRAIVEAIQAYLIQTAGQRVTHSLRCDIFRRIQLLPVSHFDVNPTGKLLTRVVNDTRTLNELFTASISVLALDVLVILGTLTAMFWVNWKLSALTLITFPAVAYSVEYFGHRLALSYREVRLRLANINGFLGENIGAVSVIQRLGAEDQRLETFRKIADGHQEASLKSIYLYSLVQPVTNLLNGVSMASLIVVGGFWVVEGSISVGILVAFFGYVRNLFQPIRDLVEKYNTFLSATVSAERIVHVLNLTSEFGPVGTDVIGLEKSSALGVRFENVSFRYAERSRDALTDVSFSLAPGESLAVVGATGSGKSTLIRLLLRFYEPTAGTIRFSDKPLSEWDKNLLRSKIGVVQQEIYLFRGTLRENLTLGRTDFSDVYLVERCERALVWPFFRDRGGLDTLIFEGGSNLSLGERQLLSFARILVFDCPVLILDEATSSLDRILERGLLEAVEETMKDRTSIVIAHRLSTIRHCDQVLVMEEGKICERGSYDELLSLGGLFTRFHNLHSQQ